MALARDLVGSDTDDMTFSLLTDGTMLMIDNCEQVNVYGHPKTKGLSIDEVQPGKFIHEDGETAVAVSQDLQNPTPSGAVAVTR